MIASEENPYNPAPLDNKIIFYDDRFFNQVQVIDFELIPTSSQNVPATGPRTFFSDDGSQVLVLLEGGGLLDQYAVQVTDR